MVLSLLADTVLLGLTNQVLLVLDFVVDFVLGLEDVRNELEAHIFRVDCVLLYPLALYFLDLFSQYLLDSFLILVLFISLEFLPVFLYLLMPKFSLIDKLLIQVLFLRNPISF